MKKKLSTRTWVVWLLVVVVFLVLIFFWIPSLVNTVQGLSAHVGIGAQQASSQINKELDVTKQQIKSLSDTISSAATDSTIAPLDKDQISALAKEIETQAGAKEDVSVGFPVHQDDPKAIAPKTDPAQVYCTRSGGRYVSRSTGGHTYGVCMFSNGTECEAIKYASQVCRVGMYEHAEDGMASLK